MTKSLVVLCVLASAMSLRAQSAISSISSFWEMDTADRIAWDSKGSAHGMYVGPGFTPLSTIFGSGIQIDTTFTTAASSGPSSDGGAGVRIPIKLLDVAGHTFCFAFWARHNGTEPIASMYQGTGTSSWKLAFNTTSGGHPYLTYWMTDNSASAVMDSTTTVDAGNLSLVWMAYDSSTGAIKVAGNGASWTSTVPSPGFQNSLHLPLDFGQQNRQFFGSAVVGRSMYWLDYIPSDAERIAIYNGGSGRDRSYFNSTWTNPVRPLTFSEVSSTFYNDNNYVAIDPVNTGRVATSDPGTTGSYWLKPYPFYLWNPTLSAMRGRYLWVRSTDHNHTCQWTGGNSKIGYSNSPETLPTTWIELVLPNNFSLYDCGESQTIVWNPDTGKFHFFAHVEVLSSSNPFKQETQVWTSSGNDPEGPYTWIGVSHPRDDSGCTTIANTNPTAGYPPVTPHCYHHTGYQYVIRNGTNDWSSQGLLEGFESGTEPLIRTGIFHSTDGLSFTLVREDTGQVFNPWMGRFSIALQGSRHLFMSAWKEPYFSTTATGTDPYYGGTPLQFDLQWPFYTAFFYYGANPPSPPNPALEWLQDLQTYEENGTVWLYGKWGYHDAGTCLTTNSVTGATWSAGTATATIGTNTLQVGQIATITGATPSGYNVANVRISAVTGTTASYAVASNPGAWSSGGSFSAGVFSVCYVGGDHTHLFKASYASLGGSVMQGQNVRQGTAVAH